MKKDEIRGWIALDIDGTITLEKYTVPSEVVRYLKGLASDGWRIAMATGRPYSFASLALSKFDFPYVFLPQNGSAVLEMPQKKCLFTHYIPKEHLKEIEKAFEGIVGDFLVYGGGEKNDVCYWRPHRFEEEQLLYLEDLKLREKEERISLQSFDELPQSNVPLVRCFGTQDEMSILAERLGSTNLFHLSSIRDPFVEGYFILLLTDRAASKGESLAEVMELQGRGDLVIAAGDDENDVSLFQVADVRIAMTHAPESLHELADLIAPPVSEQGIIRALQLVLKNHGYA